jgi:hypothetical protein
MNGIKKEFTRLEKTGSLAKCEEEIDNLIRVLEEAEQSLKADPSHNHDHLNALRTRIEQSQKKITDSEKDVYNGISKFGKSLDKAFKGGGTMAHNSALFPISPGPDLNTAVLMHLSRSGEFNVASKFMEEGQLTVPPHLLEEFAKMYGILQKVLVKDLEPAIEWAVSNREQLLAKGSNLEFSLHKLQFVKYLVEEKDIKKAVSYAQENLSVFRERYFQDTAQLMTAVLYVDKMCPYKDIFSSPSYDQLYGMFSSEFCSLLGLPPDSPLYLAVTAGAIAIPTLAKMETVMKSRRAEWTTKQELPVEIDLPDKFQFHSIFVCPISKEQTTEENPPMMLPCGHILANQSLRSLSKENPHHTFKCPYCPMDTTLSHTKRVYF